MKDTNSALTGRVSFSPRHSREYKKFVTWMALPKKNRKPKNQKLVAKKLKISQMTLSHWKKTLGSFEKEVDYRDVQDQLDTNRISDELSIKISLLEGRLKKGTSVDIQKGDQEI